MRGFARSNKNEKEFSFFPLTKHLLYTRTNTSSERIVSIIGESSRDSTDTIMKSEYGSTSKPQRIQFEFPQDNAHACKSPQSYHDHDTPTNQSTSSPHTHQSSYLESLEAYDKYANSQQGDEKEELTLRSFAIKISLYVNIAILITKILAYAKTLSLSVLAAMIDSLLDVVSQKVLEYAESHSSKVKRSSALYPAGAARLEPVGVLTCAALMGMASFEVLKESLEELFFAQGTENKIHENKSMTSVWGMLLIVIIKGALLGLCQYAQKHQYDELGKTKYLSDSTLEALAQDHLNDGLSNFVAAVALLAAMSSSSLWWVDPLGAIIISFYIIHSWYTTGKEQIEQLTGKVAPEEFIDELFEIAKNFDNRMEVDVCRAYHFGPKFLVELEVVLPKDTLLFESHDLGMELQYEIEGREEVERCFVHIDYETRPYDEHVISKVPELRERIIGNLKRNSSCHSV